MMRRMMFARGALVAPMVASALLFAASLTAAETKEVSVCGYGTIYDDSDKPRARNEAIRDAIRQAIEMGLGVEIQAETETERFQLVKDVVLVKSQGFVESYKVTGENHEHALGYEVCIDAVVGKGTPSKPCDQLVGQFVDLMGNPRIMVSGHESNPDYPDSPASLVAWLEGRMEKVGYNIVDQQQVARLFDEDVLRRLVEGDYEEASARALTLDTDYILSIELASTITGDTGGQFSLVTARCNAVVKAIVAETGEVLYSERLPEVKGAANTGEAAILKATKSLRGKIRKNVVCGELPARIGGPKNIKVVVAGCTYDETESIRSLLGGQRFVLGATQVGFEDGVAEYRVQTAGKAKELCDGLVRLSTPTFECRGVSLGSVKLLKK